jgi:hypothetical protein
MGYQNNRNFSPAGGNMGGPAMGGYGAQPPMNNFVGAGMNNFNPGFRGGMMGNNMRGGMGNRGGRGAMGMNNMGAGMGMNMPMANGMMGMGAGMMGGMGGNMGMMGGMGTLPQSFLSSTFGFG